MNEKDIETFAKEEKVAFASGATSSEKMPEYHLVPGFAEDLTAKRFAYGNHKHEKSNTVLGEANWLTAYRARDIAFFRDRASHARKHLKLESRGLYDNAPGGNLGAVGWWLEIAAFIQKHDPEFYDAINGLRPMDSLSPQPDLPHAYQLKAWDKPAETITKPISGSELKLLEAAAKKANPSPADDRYRLMPRMGQ